MNFGIMLFMIEDNKMKNLILLEENLYDIEIGKKFRYSTKMK